MDLNWPESLGDISLKNMNMTELWFLRHIIESGGYHLSHKDIQVRTPKFGYEECYVDIGNQRYLVKHKTWVSGEHFFPPLLNVVFYVRKHKNPIGK